MKRYVLVAFFACVTSCDLSGNSEDEKRRFSQLKIGMHRDQIVEILGKPDDTGFSIVDKAYSFVYFTKNKNILRGTLPVVCFDSTHLVTYFTYGD